MIRPYAFLIGTGVNGGTTTEFYSIKHINEMNFTFSILNRPQIDGNAKGHVVVIPFWLIIAVFSPFALVQWRRTYLNRRLPGHCPTCRYNLTGNTTGVCPECGEKVPQSVVDVHDEWSETDLAEFTTAGRHRDALRDDHADSR